MMEQIIGEQDNSAKQPESYPGLGPRDQNWSLIIGVGVVMLGVLIMVVNLSLYEDKASLTTSAPVARPVWIQIGRLAGLIISVGVGNWLLWLLLSRRPTSNPPYLKTYLQQAVNYTHQIEALLKTGSKGHEQQLLAQIQTWWQTIEMMARTLADLSQNDRLIQSDLRQLPGMMVELEQQLAAETNALVRADLEQILRQRQHQHLALEQLQTTRRRAEIQIERTIAVLGTIYSQLLTYRSTFHVVDYQRLADSVAEEVQQLQDYLEALQEIKGSRSTISYQ